jgi:uncharacterized iron-regulated membrane protein
VGGFRRPSNQALFRFHGWLGINLGLLLFVVCFSGAIATVSQELEWLLNPAVRATPPGEGAAYSSWTSWYIAAQREHPGGRVISVDRPDGPRWAARATVAYSDLDWRHVYVDPYTARVTGSFSEFGIPRFFRSFHKQFYIYPGSLPHGVYAVGPLGLVLLLSLCTGLLFYRFRWRDLLMRGPWRTRRAFWSALHRATGMWTVPMAILITATGVWYFVERAVGDADIPLPADTPTWVSPAMPPSTASTWPISLDDAVTLAVRSVPALDVRSISIADGNGLALTLRGQTDAWLVRDAANSIRVNPREGRVERVTLAEGLHPLARWGHTADPLHFGSFGGIVSKTIWLAAGLFSSFAILLGLRVWYLRSVPEPGLGARPAGALAAIGATLVVLAVSIYGCVVNIGDALHSEAAPRFSNPGTVGAGDHRLAISLANDGSRVHVLAAVDGTDRAAIRRAWAWLGDASVPGTVPADAVRLDGRWEGLRGTIPLEQRAGATRVWIAAAGDDAPRVAGSVTVPARSLTPVEEVIPASVWVVIALFGAACAAVCLAWYRWIQRSTSVAVRRTLAGTAASRTEVGGLSPTGHALNRSAR